jgi:nitroreductase
MKVGENYRQMLLNLYPQKDAEENTHAAKQAYIAFQACCRRFEGADSTPLEGFDADALDEILGLRAKGLRSVMLPVGYRDTENDWLVNLTKVRKAKKI